MSTIGRLSSLRMLSKLTRIPEAQKNALSAEVAKLAEKVGQLQKQINQLQKQNRDLQGRVSVQEKTTDQLNRKFFRLFQQRR